MGEFFAVVLSFFIIGLGQLYNGQAMKGVLLLFGAIVLGIITGGLLIIPIWLYGMFDAYTVAKERAKKLNA
jgi:TM2 domain-containing membrane protein YozV